MCGLSLFLVKATENKLKIKNINPILLIKNLC